MRLPNSKAPSTLTMRRTGYFSFRTNGGSHCGTASQQRARYDIVCKCSAHTLDDRGFLFDQLGVDSVFGIKQTSLSCEQLCYIAARELYRLAKGQNPKVDIQSLAVTISPDPFQASMTWEWTR